MQLCNKPGCLKPSFSYSGFCLQHTSPDTIRKFIANYKTNGSKRRAGLLIICAAAAALVAAGILILPSRIDNGSGREKRAPRMPVTAAPEQQKTAPLSDREYFKIAENALYSGYLEEAVQNYEKLIASHPGSELVPDAYYMLGTNYIYIGQLDKAVESWSALTAKYPGHRRAADALYGVGFIYENYKKDSKKAIEYYNRVLNEYGSTPWAKEAVMAVDRIANAGDYE